MYEGGMMSDDMTWVYTAISRFFDSPYIIHDSDYSIPAEWLLR
jgi:hypothetical protein